MNRVILHCDMNNYFASVECLDKAYLRNRPVAVCGDPAMRHGIVLAKNEAAKKYGVKTGEPNISARSKCPSLVILRPHYEKYLHFAQLSRKIYKRYTEFIYPFGIDEAWLDVSESCGTVDEGALLADRIREDIRKELGLTISVGVSFNYIFAKLGSDMKKPDATTVVAPESFKETVWRLPAQDLLFVGSATGKALRKLGILTIGDLARSDIYTVSHRLGKTGCTLWRYAWGDDSSFEPGGGENEIKSIGNSVTPPRDICCQEDAEAFLYVLAEAVAERLKRHGMKASCVSVMFRRSDFSCCTRQHRLNHSTADPEVIYGYLNMLFSANHSWKHNLRSIGARVERLTGNEGEQLTLCEITSADFPPSCGVEKAKARIRSRFGGLCLETGVAPGTNQQRGA